MQQFEALTVLIVDDAAENRFLLQGIVKKLGDIRILEADCGETAVELALKERPDLVLMDLLMPRMDGFEATSRIKEAFPATIVVVVTAVLDEATEMRMRRTGATTYIRKPIRPEKVRIKLSNILAYIKSRQIGAKEALGNRPFTPFAKEVRSMRTMVNVLHEDQMMDFGLWLTERYLAKQPVQSVAFNRILEFLYGVIARSLKRHMPVNIMVEEGFDALYLAFTLNETLPELSEFIVKEIPLLGDDLMQHDGFTFIKVGFGESKTAPAKPVPAAPKPESKEADIPEEAREVRRVEGYETRLLRHSHTHKITASEYQASLDDATKEEVGEVGELLAEWQEHMDNFTDQPTWETLKEMGGVISHVASVVNGLFEFTALGYGLSSLAIYLQNIDPEQFTQLNYERLTPFIQGMLEDLKQWREMVFYRQETGDIHYLDSSLLSSCMQIEALFSGQNLEVEDDDNELELF